MRADAEFPAASSPAADAAIVERYHPAAADEWDAFVAASPDGVFLQSRRFLGYHGDRFDDRSLLFRRPSGRLCGVLPAAVDPADPSVVVSHPGATYGGLLLPPGDVGLLAADLVAAAAAHYAAQGFDRLDYRNSPPPLRREPRVVDEHALWRAGAAVSRRDLWSVIELDRPPAFGAERRRRLRHAEAARLDIRRDDSDDAYAGFHALLSGRLAERHGAQPVHTLAEMRELRSRFPGHIALWLARSAAGECAAGEWIFDLGAAWHGQYGAASEAGRNASAQDLLLARVIDAAREAGARRFSFGTSTEDAGRRINEGLFRYKASFGAGSVLHDRYLLPLRTGPAAPRA